MDSNPVIRRNDRAAFRALTENEGGVLLHLDSGSYHGLNAMGTLIWNLIGEGSKLSDLVAAVSTELTDSPADLPADVATFIEDLAQRDLLTLSAE